MRPHPPRPTLMYTLLPYTTLFRSNLHREGVPAYRIVITGNTVIDALLEVVNRLRADDGLRAEIAGSFPFDLGERRLILVTGHRRESFGEGFERICQALSEIATRFPDVDIVYPVHLNPNVREPVMRWLSGIDNIHLIEPIG